MNDNDVCYQVGLPACNSQSVGFIGAHLVSVASAGNSSVVGEFRVAKHCEPGRGVLVSGSRGA